MSIQRISITISIILFIIGFIFINKQKQYSFIESNLIEQYVQQKVKSSSKYGQLIQKNNTISLFDLNCNNDKCNAILQIEEKKVNTEFNFEKESSYIPLISEFNASLTKVNFK